MDRTQYEIEIRNHAFIRAMERGIHPDLIENCIKNRSIKRFGKNYVKFMTNRLFALEK